MKTKGLSFIRFILFIFIGVFLYNSYFLTVSAGWNPGYKIHKVECIKDGFGDYTGSGYLDIEFKSDEEATYNRRYLIDRPGYIRVGDFIDSGWARAKVCPNFVAPAANACIGRGAGHFSSWSQYDSVEELGVLINSNAPIKRLTSSDYSINGNYTTVAGFGGTGFIDTADAFYDSAQKTYTFYNSLIQLKIKLGDDTLAGSGYIELYQTSSGSILPPKRIERLSFLNANSELPLPDAYPLHTFGVLSSGDEVTDKKEFFFTGSLFANLNVANQIGGLVVLPNSDISLSGSVISLSGSSVSLTAGIFGLPTSVITLGNEASISLSGSTIPLVGNIISVTDSNILTANKFKFGSVSLFDLDPVALGGLTATTVSLDTSIASLNGAFGSLFSTGSLNGDIASLSGSIFSNSGTISGTGNITFGTDSLFSLSNSITLTGSVVLLNSSISLSGSTISSTGSFFGGSGTIIGSTGSIILGNNSSIIMDSILVSLSGSIISLSGSLVGSSGSILLGSNSLISLTNNEILSTPNINGVNPSIILGGGYITLGSNSITTLSGSVYLGLGDLVLERRKFTRIEDGYIQSSTNVYDYYTPIKGIGSKSKNIERANSGEVTGCDTEVTVETNGAGDKCPEDVEKAYLEGNLKSVELRLQRKKLNCEIEHFNIPGIIDSDTTIFTAIPIIPPAPSSTVIIPVADNFYFGGYYSGGVYTGSTINGGGFDYLNRMIVMATGGNYHIEGIEYVNPFNSTGTLDKIVGKLVNPIDSDDIIGDASTDTVTWFNQGLGSHEINDLVEDRNFNIETMVRGDYNFKLEFYDKVTASTGDLVEIDNIVFPLTIVPTNNMEVVGNGVVTYPGGGFPHANNDQMSDHTDVANICYNIQDEFDNPIGFKSYAGVDNYTALTTLDYSAIRGVDYGDYQTGTGTNIKGQVINFPLDFNSYLLTRGTISTGIELDQQTSAGESVEIKDNNSVYHGLANTGPTDTKHLMTFEGSKVCFNIQSYAPSNKQLRFNLTIPTHNRDYDITPDGGVIASTNSTDTANVRFEKPFSGVFHIYDDDEFKIGTEQTMRIDVKKNDAECSAVICSSNFTISNYLNSFTSANGFYSVLRKDTEVKINGIVSIASLPTPWMVPIISDRTRLDFVLNYVSLDPISSHSVYGVMADVWITNNVDGKNVKYRINTDEVGGNNTWMSSNETAFYGVKALGALEGESAIGTSTTTTITGQQLNFSNVDKLEMRKQIKSNAYDLLRKRTVDEVIDGVRYVSGDLVINGNGVPGNGNQAYETLIIKNGNLTISGSGRVITNNLGIIVIKDDLSDKTLGNIYITPDVTEIKAMIYTDGSIISKPDVGYYTNNSLISGMPEDTPARTKDLQKQLILKGSLFSRNTIGGAIGIAPFTCPGGSDCSSFDEAVQYDLNYIRRGFEMCDHNSDGDCLDIGEYVNIGFIVEYNPQNQINPPKGFENE